MAKIFYAVSLTVFVLEILLRCLIKRSLHEFTTTLAFTAVKPLVLVTGVQG